GRQAQDVHEDLEVLRTLLAGRSRACRAQQATDKDEDDERRRRVHREQTSATGHGSHYRTASGQKATTKAAVDYSWVRCEYSVWTMAAGVSGWLYPTTRPCSRDRGRRSRRERPRTNRPGGFSRPSNARRVRVSTISRWAPSWWGCPEGSTARTPTGPLAPGHWRRHLAAGRDCPCTSRMNGSAATKPRPGLRGACRTGVRARSRSMRPLRLSCCRTISTGRLLRPGKASNDSRDWNSAARPAGAGRRQRLVDQRSARHAASRLQRRGGLRRFARRAQRF